MIYADFVDEEQPLDLTIIFALADLHPSVALEEAFPENGKSDDELFTTLFI